MKSGLLMVLMVVIMFLVVMMMFISIEISIGSFIKFVSPCVNDCVVQYGSRAVWFGRLKGFSRNFSDVGVEP